MSSMALNVSKVANSLLFHWPLYNLISQLESALQSQSLGTKQKGCWHSILPSYKSFRVHGPECRQILRTSEHLFNQR